jgi:hypothetical protein
MQQAQAQQAPLTPEQRRAAEEAAGLRPAQQQQGGDDKATAANTLPGGVFLKGEVSGG